MTLRAMMALPEPQRSTMLANAVQSGAVFYLRARGSRPVTRRYGPHQLEVPTRKGGKPFVAAHAIHLMWYCADQIEEVAGE